MLRLIILITLVYLVLRWLTRRTSARARTFKSKPPPNFSGYASKPGSSDSRTVDEMKPCVQCGTYIPTRLAWRKNELYFCGEQCQEAFQRQKA